MENLILKSPMEIASACEEVSRARGPYAKSESELPSIREIESRIDEETQSDDVKKTMPPQWIYRIARETQTDLNVEGNLKRSGDEFEELLQNPEWRRICCPGNHVLKRLRQWIQSEYKLTLTSNKLFKHFEPDEELIRLFKLLDDYVARELA